jgi:hypothetical protein
LSDVIAHAEHQQTFFPIAGERDVPEAASWRPWNRTVEGPTAAVSGARDGEANGAEGIYRSPIQAPLLIKVPGLYMLEITPIMNSSTEEILAFKTCCGLNSWDQNLEIMVKNNGDRPAVVPSYFDLEGKHGVKRIDTLMPNGRQKIEPGRFISFYCFMDELVWNQAKRLIFFDMEGNTYHIDVVP